MSNNEVEENFLIKLANAYNCYDCSNLGNMLADDVTYDSFWVLDQIKSKAKYLEYLKHKLIAMQKSNKRTHYVMMYRQGSGKPVLMVTPKTPEGDFGGFTAEANLQGLINAIHIMPTSFLNPLGYKDKNAFDEFMKEANKC